MDTVKTERKMRPGRWVVELEKHAQAGNKVKTWVSYRTADNWDEDKMTKDHEYINEKNLTESNGTS